MAYHVPPVFAHGDIPTAAQMNNYKNSLQEIYDILGGKYRSCAVAKRQFLTKASDTLNDGLTDDTNSYFTNRHLWRWLLYRGEGAIVDMSNENEVSLADDTSANYNVFDLDSIDWLNYGGLYRINGVTWATEDFNP